MALANENTPAETASGIGGFFGDLLAGIKDDAIDALGGRIREQLGVGVKNGARPTDPDPIRARTVAGEPIKPKILGFDRDMVLLTFGGITAAVALFVLVKGN